MRRSSLFLAVALTACAGAKLKQALAEKTETFIIDRPLAEVWPTVHEVFDEENFPAFSTGPANHLETAMLSPEGTAPAAATTQGGIGASRPRRGQGSPPPVEHVGGKVVKFVIDGEVVDGTHCRVKVVRHVRDSIEALDSEVARDPLMEWAIIARLEPDRADAIRKELAAQGIQAP